MSKLASLLKKLPVDFGQAERKYDAAAKQIAFSFVPQGTGRVACDIGCRDGFWSERLRSHGYEVRSLDIEPTYRGALRHDIETGLPYPNQSIDLLWPTEVMEHLHNPAQFLKEIDRVMKPGGRAILTTPNSHWWLYSLFRLWGWTPQKVQNPDHKQFFSEATIRALAPTYELNGYFPYAVKFWRIRRLIGPLSPTFILMKQF